MAVVKHIAPASAFKIGLAAYGVLGIFIGIICALIAIAGTSFARTTTMPFTGVGMGIAAIIVCPIVYGIIGGIAAVIGALLYNLAAGWVGGLEVDLG